MLEVLHVFAATMQLLLIVTSYAMAARMILPLFVEPDGSAIYAFTCVLSEPLVAPIRYILAMLGVGEDSPMDFSLPIAYLAIFVLRLILPQV